MPSLETLPQDIYNVLEGRGNWNDSNSNRLSADIQQAAWDRFSSPEKPRGYLSPSLMGKKCGRHKWLKVNDPESGIPIDGQALGNFFYGVMIEALVVEAAIAAGHEVSHIQHKVDCYGVPGSMDCIIDGIPVDVKSASEFSFGKFKNNGLIDDDPFGYLSQLSSYASQVQDEVREKNVGAFVAINKNRFEIVIDKYDLTDWIAHKEMEAKANLALVNNDEMPPKPYSPIPQSTTSPNMKLHTECRWCEFRKKCFPEVRRFVNDTGYEQWLTTVKKIPGGSYKEVV